MPARFRCPHCRHANVKQQNVDGGVLSVRTLPTSTAQRSRNVKPSSPLPTEPHDIQPRLAAKDAAESWTHHSSLVIYDEKSDRCF